CAAIPEALLESELFGYEEGAFTGARRGGKPGKFELADGGTLFLDEIGDMSLALQAKLLRVLQERRIERVGGLETIAIDVRIIAATHKNIEAMVRTGEFRSDLYYRVNVFPLYIPPLHCRREDILPLAEAFLTKYCAIFNKSIALTDERVRNALLSYDWPGNVRELENIVEYLVNVETSSVISLSSLPQRIRQQEMSQSGPLGIMPLAELEKAAIRNALTRFGTSTEGKIRAAEALGISKATLYRKLKEYETDCE
ncbi:MAG: sigma-54 interaction domain-containing protein, partial [Sporomusa sp.]